MAVKAPGFLSPLGLKQGHSCYPASLLAESRREVERKRDRVAGENRASDSIYPDPA